MLLLFYFIILVSHQGHFLLLLERKKGRGRNIDTREKRRLVASHLCPEQHLVSELNPQPFRLETTLQPAEPATVARAKCYASFNKKPLGI